MLDSAQQWAIHLRLLKLYQRLIWKFLYQMVLKYGEFERCLMLLRYHFVGLTSASIARTKDVDAEVGIAPSESRGIVSLSPDERVAWYGDLLAPLTIVLPPLQDSGRQDAIAALGQRFGDKSTEKKVRKAQKKLEKGDTKQFASLEGDLKWVRFFFGRRVAVLC